MSNQPRLMVDIETLGTPPGSAALLSIGAVGFGIGPVGADIGREFHVSIDSDSSELAGLPVDEETVAWWQSQDETAREILDGGVSLPRGLLDFAEFVREGEYSEVWANSPRFDAVLIEAAFAQVGIDSLPWAFYNEADVRTLRLLPFWPDDYEREGTHHDALDDCRYQARCVAETLRRSREAAQAWGEVSV